MTFEECTAFIETINEQAIGRESNGKRIQVIIPLPEDMSNEHLIEWVRNYWGYGIHQPPRSIHELKKSYQVFHPAYLFLLSTDDPTSVRVEWLYKDFPDLLPNIEARE